MSVNPSFPPVPESDHNAHLDQIAVEVGLEDPVMFDDPRIPNEDAAHIPNGYRISDNNVFGALPPITGYPLLFTGVLKCRYDAIKILFEKKFGPTFRLMGVDVLDDRWYVYVKTLGEAAEVILRMDKLVFHGGVLCVRYLHPNGTLLHVSQVNQLIQQRNYNTTVTMTRRNNGYLEFSPRQMQVFNEIFENFHKLPYRFTSGVPIDPAIRAIRKTQCKAPTVIRMALKEYGYALLSTCLKGKFVQDGWLKIMPNKPTVQEERRVAEACQKQPQESWEPFGQDSIDSVEVFIQYMKAMLRRFGPMNIYTSLRLRLATFIGQSTFQAPATARELIYFLEQNSPDFVVVDDTIFDITSSDHVRILRDHLTNEFSRSDKFSITDFMNRFIINGN
ncbi:unnamed protein product [Bursaphelenchus xylophilus]|uniref:(pine wood nematode) hypothetical protein n=1 Tax=Bursaphelenchus xylophilus TaxID=6326 RepID=A0A1I7RVD0_BURXY|nr:unnamed protein product [Bursaphelenchus xylophilus]CAG9086689.1 unnamed protein product [Bursaphelenchus xylophilus]